MKFDDPPHHGDASRILDDPPAFAVAETRIQHVERQCWVGVVAEWAVAADVLDPCQDGAVEIDGVIDRHGQHVAAIVAADLIAGKKIDHRLIEDRVLRSVLSRGGERTRGGVAIWHVGGKAETGLNLREDSVEVRERRGRKRGHDGKWLAVEAAHILAALAQAKIDQLLDDAPRRCGLF